MQSFVLASALGSMISSVIAAPTAFEPSPVPIPGSEVYRIKNFYERKPDGQDITSLSFDILATNGASLDFTCIAYDPATEQATTNFEDGHVYACAKNTEFAFSYSEKADDPMKGRLFLWQGENEGLIQGNVTIPTPYCHAGGNGINDQVCVVPEAAGEITITLTAPGS